MFWFHKFSLTVSGSFDWGCIKTVGVGVKSFEDLDLKDLNPFFKGFEILLRKKDFEFGIDLNPFVLGQNPTAFKNPLNFNGVMCVYF